MLLLSTGVLLTTELSDYISSPKLFSELQAHRALDSSWIWTVQKVYNRDSISLLPLPPVPTHPGLKTKRGPGPPIPPTTIQLWGCTTFASQGFSLMPSNHSGTNIPRVAQQGLVHRFLQPYCSLSFSSTSPWTTAPPQGMLLPLPLFTLLILLSFRMSARKLPQKKE